MAIVKRVGRNGKITYQVKVVGTDGAWVTATFEKRADAVQSEAKLKLQVAEGGELTGRLAKLTLNQYFEMWNEETKHSGVSEGWRKDQIRYFERFVSNEIGNRRVQKIRPVDIARVLSAMVNRGLGSQMQVHVFNIIHKMFEDAIELFQLSVRNPAIQSIRPKLLRKEPKYLNLEQIKILLSDLRGDWMEGAVLLQFFAGLRIGEVQALKWKSVDFDRGRLLIQGTYVRKEARFKNSPKGGDQHWVPMLEELADFLRVQKLLSGSTYVVSPPRSEFLSYNAYYRRLKARCKRLGLPSIGTHGLRHSTSELLLENGASVYELNALFDHSDLSVTEGYMHGRGERLEKLTNVIRLYPKIRDEPQVSQMLPIPEYRGNEILSEKAEIFCK